MALRIARSLARKTSGHGLRTLGARSMSTTESPRKVLITGGSGQIGVELAPYLRRAYGEDSVIVSDIKKVPAMQGSKFVYLDVTDKEGMKKLVAEEEIDTVVHLASLLSGVAEQNPHLALQVNVRGIENVLEVARQFNLRIFAPSTIAVFGPTTPKIDVPQLTVMRPTTMYGVSKVYLELLGEYYASKFGVDFRSVRYPGIISSKGEPGGGTTDYAVDIFYHALKQGSYTCFLSPDTSLPMMYMPDTLQVTEKLLAADPTSLSQRSYNLTAYSFTPEQLAAEIRRHIPSFTMHYEPDFRQQIADTWPASIDDSVLRRDLGWQPNYSLPIMVDHMLASVHAKLTLGNGGPATENNVQLHAVI